MKTYETPMLYVDSFVTDTIAASVIGGGPKNANADNNQNCWGCKSAMGELDPGNPQNMCTYLPGTAAYSSFC